MMLQIMRLIEYRCAFTFLSVQIFTWQPIKQVKKLLSPLAVSSQVKKTSRICSTLLRKGSYLFKTLSKDIVCHMVYKCCQPNILLLLSLDLRLKSGCRLATVADGEVCMRSLICKDFFIHGVVQRSAPHLSNCFGSRVKTLNMTSQNITNS